MASIELRHAGDLSIAVPSPYRAANAPHVGSPVILGLRPEDFYEAQLAPDWQPIPFTVVAVEALGAELVLVGQIDTAGPSAPQDIAVRLSRHVVAAPGQRVTLYLDAKPMHLFDPASTKLIPRPAPQNRTARVA